MTNATTQTHHTNNKEIPTMSSTTTVARTRVAPSMFRHVDPDPLEPPADPLEPPADQIDPPTTPNTGEAAKYRRQLRAAETERDQLRDQLGELRRGEVERLAAGQLTNPDDLFALGSVSVDELLDDAGQVNAEAVSARIAEVLKVRPYLALPKLSSSSADQGRREHAPGPPSFSALFRDRKGR